MSRIHYFILSLVIICTAACSGTNNENLDSEQTESAVDASVQTETTRATTSSRSVAPPAPSQPQPQPTILQAGTIIRVRLQDTLDTAVNQSGDTFRALVDQDFLVGDKVVVPRGSLVEGKLTFVERSGRVSGRAAMSLQFVSLNVGSRSYPLQTEILSFEAESTKKKDVTKVGIASGIGAAIGAIAGGGKGAAIGAAVGAGAGGAGVAATRGEEVQFLVEDVLEFTLNENVPISIQ